MRVAVTMEQFWHAVPGGVATSTAELVRAVSARPDVEVVGVAARHREPMAEAYRSDARVMHLPVSRRLLYESWQLLRRPVVERATGPVDVVHDMAYVVPPSRAPMVATVHDLWFLEHPDHYTRHAAVVLRRGFELARRHARLIVCPSRSSVDACRAAGIESDRLRMVPWGVRPRVVAPDNASRVLARFGLERPYILSCGTIEQRKNVLRLLEAFEGLDRTGVDLVLAGPRGWSPEGWNERLDRAVVRLGKRCRVLGDVPARELDALCAGAAVVAYPSLGEGFGFPVLYAMAQGAPVVTSSGTSTEELAGDAAVLVDPNDVDALADALARVLDDPALANDLSERGRQRATAFTWDRAAEQVLEVYGEAVAGS